MRHETLHCLGPNGFHRIAYTEWGDPGAARVVVLNRAGFPGDGAVGPPLAVVSSTDIRDRLARGELPSDLVPRGVLDYAREHHLYGL